MCCSSPRINASHCFCAGCENVSGEYRSFRVLATELVRGMTLDQVVTHQISQLLEVADTLTSGPLCGECQPRLDWFLTQVQRTCWPKVHIFSLLTIEESYVSVQRWQRELAGSSITLHFSSRRWVRCYSGTFLHCSSGDVLPHKPQSTCSTVLQVWSHHDCTDYWKMKRSCACTVLHF